MRIALYQTLPSGGAKRFVYESVRRLIASHAVDAYGLSPADHAFLDIRPYVRNYRVYPFVPRHQFRSPFGRLNQLQRWRDVSEIDLISREIARDMEREGYDVVFAHPCLYTFIPAVLRYVTIPSVYRLAEAFGPALVRSFDRPYLARQRRPIGQSLNRIDPLIALYNHRVEYVRKKSLECTTLLLANSRFTQNRMKNAYGVDSEVCYWGLDAAAFSPVHGVSKEDCVISVGELTPRKGFDFLVSSLALLPESKRPLLKLVCNYQDPAERSYIEDLAAWHNVRLGLLMNLNTQQLAVEYSKARLCVYAPVLEPFGVVPLEAMACGIPVVGVAEGGVKETVVDGLNGRLVARDPRAFADAVASLLDDGGLREQYGRQAREHVLANWTWDAAVNRLEHYLEKTATARSNRYN